MRRPPASTVFCAGVGAGADGGGCVDRRRPGPDVIGPAPTVAAARDGPTPRSASISWPGMHHRTDIAEEASR